MRLTPFGRACNLVRENADRAEFVGYDTHVVRFIAFCMASFFAGVAGALSAINFELMSLSSLSGIQSGMILLMTYIGGIGTFAGPVLGAILITYLQIMLSDVTSAWLMYFGLLFMIVVLYLPGGLAGGVETILTVMGHGRARRLVPICLLSIGPLIAAAAGGVLLIELAYRVFDTTAKQSELIVGGIDMPATSIFPWAIGLTLVIFGSGLVARLRVRLTDVWSASAGGMP